MSITTSSPAITTSSRSAATDTYAAATRPTSSRPQHRRTTALTAGTAAAAALVAVTLAVVARPAAPAAPTSRTRTGAVGARTGAQALQHEYRRTATTDVARRVIVPPVTASSPFAPIGQVGASAAVRHYGIARATQLESTQSAASQPTARQARGNEQLTGAFRYGGRYEQ